MLFMSKTRIAPRPALLMASRVRLSRYSCRRRKSTRSSQSTCMRPGAGSDATGNSALGMLVRNRRAVALSVIQAVGDLPVIGVELQVGAPGFHLEKAREIHIAQLVSDQVDDDLMHERRSRQRNVELAPGREPELEILSK